MTPRESVIAVRLVWGKASTDVYQAVRFDSVVIGSHATYGLSRRSGGESSRDEDGGTHLDVC
jgi:hypothetical protein